MKVRESYHIGDTVLVLEYVKIDTVATHRSREEATETHLLVRKKPEPRIGYI